MSKLCFMICHITDSHLRHSLESLNKQLRRTCMTEQADLSLLDTLTYATVRYKVKYFIDRFASHRNRCSQRHVFVHSRIYKRCAGLAVFCCSHPRFLSRRRQMADGRFRHNISGPCVGFNFWNFCTSISFNQICSPILGGRRC